MKKIIFDWLRRLFKVHSPSKINVQYEEKFTTCDKCERLHECIKNGNVLERTTLEDSYTHYIVGRGCSCPYHVGKEKSNE